MKAKKWIMMVCVTSAMLGVGSQAYASKDCDGVVAKGVVGHKLLNSKERLEYCHNLKTLKGKARRAYIKKHRKMIKQRAADVGLTR